MQFKSLPDELHALHEREKCPIPKKNLQVAFQRQGSFTVCLLSPEMTALVVIGVSKCALKYDQFDQLRGEQRAFRMAVRNLRGAQGLWHLPHYDEAMALLREADNLFKEYGTIQADGMCAREISEFVDQCYRFDLLKKAEIA